MTVESYSPLSSPYAGLETGTEDFSASDFSIARWKIDHNKGVFVNNQNDDEYPYLDVIILNQVKQRVMFGPITEEDKPPQCKSNDFTTGYPGDEFPWEAWNGPEPAGSYELNCPTCPFAQWGQRDTPTAKPKPPKCAELHTFPIIVLNGGDENIGFLSVKGTSISPSKKYVSYFATKKVPMLTVVTRLTLEAALYKARTYYVVKFENIGASDDQRWIEYSDSSRLLREYLRQPPRSAEEPPEVAELEANTTTYEKPPAPISAPQQARPVAAPAAPSPVQQRPTQPRPAAPQPPAQARMRPQAPPPAAPPAAQPDPWANSETEDADPLPF